MLCREDALQANYPETNNLVSIKDFADKSFTPAYKSVPVRLIAQTQ